MSQHRVNVLWLEAAKKAAPAKHRNMPIKTDHEFALEWGLPVEMVTAAREFWAKEVRVSVSPTDINKWIVLSIYWDGAAQKAMEDRLEHEKYFAEQDEANMVIDHAAVMPAGAEAMCKEFYNRCLAECDPGAIQTDGQYEELLKVMFPAIMEDYPLLVNVFNTYSNYAINGAKVTPTKEIMAADWELRLGHKVMAAIGRAVRVSGLGAKFGKHHGKSKNGHKTDVTKAAPVIIVQDSVVVEAPMIEPEPVVASNPYERVSDVFDVIPSDEFLALYSGLTISAIAKQRAACVKKGYKYQSLYRGGGWRVEARPKTLEDMTQAELLAKLGEFPKEQLVAMLANGSKK